MGLANFVVDNRVVKIKGSELTLTGLTFNQLSTLLIGSMQDIDGAMDLFDKYTGGKGATITPEGLQQFTVAMLTEMPSLTAKLIAVACGEADQWETAMKLPAPKQLEALMAVAEMTFEEPAAVKKFIENLTLAARASSEAIAMLKPQDPLIAAGG